MWAHSARFRLSFTSLGGDGADDEEDPEDGGREVEEFESREAECGREEFDEVHMSSEPSHADTCHYEVDSGRKRMCSCAK